MKSFIRKYLFPGALISALLLIAFSETGCKKQSQLTSGGEVRFSTDTLAFDTVFTTQGSFTLSLRIINPQNQKIVLRSVRLEQGNNSFFKLNVDGFAGNEVKDVEIAANDSAYVFATVKVDPTNANSPFFIQDKLIATLNGTEFSIPFEAYGQNANYVVDSTLNGNITWDDPKPYVIIHSALVDAGATLTIAAGARIFMHADSRLLVDGTLIVNGTKKDSVVFQGDRLDRSYFGYEGYPGEWGGLYFTSHSGNNELHYTVIKNGGNTAFGTLPAAVQVNRDSSGSLLQLYMDRVTIENSIGYGLLSFGGHIRVENSLIHTAGAQALALVEGGNYELDNCTIANYGTDKVSHTQYSAAILLNYFSNNNIITSSALKATLRNCVIYGSLQNELVADSIDTAPCAITLQACVVKAEQNKIPAWVVRDGAVQFNADPLFTDITKWDFRPKTGSPLINAGINLSGATPPIRVSKDLDDKLRTGAWDIGAYEAD